jgi:hypothetical protein
VEVRKYASLRPKQELAQDEEPCGVGGDADH